jgi:pimeloyl-ACP methyl ester carboxylesterase
VKLVLLHPLPLDGTIWSAATADLTVEFLAPTLYPLGDDLEDWARAVLELAGSGPLLVVGNSVGGSCAVEMARLAPTRVKGLVLCGTNVVHRPEPALRDEALGILAAGDLQLAWDRYWAPLFGPTVAPALVDRAWRVAQSHGSGAIAAGVRAFHCRADRSGFVRGWPGPTWVVSGEHDVRPARSRALASNLARGEYLEVGGAGHYLPLEAPAAIDGVIRAALDQARG